MKPKTKNTPASEGAEESKQEDAEGAMKESEKA